MKKIILMIAIGLFGAVLSIPLWAQMVVPTTPGGAGSGAFNPASISGLYCLLTGCTITPGPLVVDGEFEVNNALISACGSGGAPCSAGPAFVDRVGINTSTPATILDVNGSVTIGTLFAQFDAVNNTVGINVGAGVDPTIPLNVGGAITFANTATACGAGNIGSIRNNLGDWGYCDGITWWTVVRPTVGPPSPVLGSYEINSADVACNGVFGDCADGDEIQASNGLRGQGLFSAINCDVSCENGGGLCNPDFLSGNTGIFYRFPCVDNSNPKACLDFSYNYPLQVNSTRNTYLYCPTAIGGDPTFTECIVSATNELGMKGGTLVNSRTQMPPGPWPGPPTAMNWPTMEGGFLVAEATRGVEWFAVDGSPGGGPSQEAFLPGQIQGEISVICTSVNAGIGQAVISRGNGWNFQSYQPNAMTDALGGGGGVWAGGTVPQNLFIGGGVVGSWTNPIFNGAIFGYYYYRDALTVPQLTQAVSNLLGEYRGYQ